MFLEEPRELKYQKLTLIADEVIKLELDGLINIDNAERSQYSYIGHWVSIF